MKRGTKRYSLSLSPIGKAVKSTGSGLGRLWNTIDVFVIIFGGIGAVISGIGGLVYWGNTVDRAARIEADAKSEFSRVASQVKDGGAAYEILDQNSVEYIYPSHNPKYKQTYNFQTQTVYLRNLVDYENRFLTFKEYNNPNDINHFRNIACTLKGRLTEKMNQYAVRFEEEYEDRESIISVSNDFIKKNCAPVVENQPTLKLGVVK